MSGKIRGNVDWGLVVMTILNTCKQDCHMYSVPGHSEHPLQSFQLHFSVHGCERALQYDLQTPAPVLAFVVISVRCVHTYI